MDMTEVLNQHLTPTGIRIEGPFENDRNTVWADLFKAIIRECFGVCDVIIGHHVVYQVAEHRPDGFVYQLVQEIPSADALIFNHDVARKLWGDAWEEILRVLACEPVVTRDALLAKFYYGRQYNENSEPAIQQDGWSHSVKAD